MTPFLFFLSFMLGIPVQQPADHVFHVSRCEIRHNTAKQTVEVTLHIFIDDLEEALKKQGHDKLFLCTEKENTSANTHLLQYFQQQFQLQINGKTVNYTFIGKEMSDDMIAAWCYLEIPKVKTIKSLLVKNKLLLETFKDQKNIIQVIVPGKKDGYTVLDSSHAEEMFVY